MKRFFTILLICLGICAFSATALAADNTAKQVEAGNNFTFVLANDGTLYGCGSNFLGVLGVDVETINDGSVWNVVPRPYKIAEGVKAVAANTNNMWGIRRSLDASGRFTEEFVGNHCLILMENGDLFAQGDNAYGQLGQGDNEHYEGMQFVMGNVNKISAGDTFSVCITEDGALYYWGRMQNQERDGGSYAEIFTPHLLGSSFVDVSAGGGHIVALDANGSVWTTGCKYNGACGDGQEIGMASELTKVFDGAVAVSAGQTHTLVLTAGGQVFGWGSNKSYQLGQYIPPEESRTYSKCFPTPVFVMDDAKAIEAGYDNSMVIKTNGDLWAFGTNYDGQLGIGYTDYNGAPIKTATDVKAAALGKQFAVITKTDGTTYASGNNFYYNFGNGNKLYNVLSWVPALLTASPVLEEGELGFADVPNGAYYFEPVSWAVKNYITSGTSPTTFSPDDTCTRAQMITLLWRAAGGETPIVINQYKDTDKNAFYFSALRWCQEKHISDPYIDNNFYFAPNNACTRAMAVEFMWKYAGSPDYDTASLPFTDIKKNASYAKVVAWALDTGITSGVTENTFRPNDTCTRAQIVTFLYRLFS